MLRAVEKAWLCVLCISLLSVSCTNTGSNPSESNQDQQTTILQEATISNANSTKELRDRLQKIAETAQGRVGVTATLLETGETVTFNGNQQFPMQSVYKFPIGMAVLAQIDQGKLALDQQVRVKPNDFVTDLQHSPIRDAHPQGVEMTVAELLKYMVSESDGTACDVLLRLLGGPETVAQYLQGLGITDVVVANTEKEIGQDNAVQYRNYATPDEAVALIRQLHERRGLSEASQAFLLNLMIETPTGMNRIKGLLPEGTIVAHKTGTSRTVDGVTAATNDVGLVTLPNGKQMAIAVFISDSTADDATREAVIAQITRTIWDEWS